MSAAVKAALAQAHALAGFQADESDRAITAVLKWDKLVSAVEAAPQVGAPGALRADAATISEFAAGVRRITASLGRTAAAEAAADGQRAVLRARRETQNAAEREAVASELREVQAQFDAHVAKFREQLLGGMDAGEAKVEQ